MSDPTNSLSVSVVIPTCNRRRRLPEALDSVFAQDVPGLQVIVVDDGSTDGTREALARFGDRIDYVYQANRGPAAARNRGIALARGDLISFLDSDDLWLPGKTLRELEVLTRNHSTDAVVSNSERWQDGHRLADTWFDSTLGAAQPAQAGPLAAPPQTWAWRKVYATCALTIRRAAIVRIGAPPFDERLPFYEDFGFALGMIRSCEIHALPDILSRVRRFSDDFRVGRPLPGTPYSAAVKVAMAYCCHRALSRAIRGGGWSASAAEELDRARAHAAAVCAGNGRGRSRIRGLKAALGELGHGDWRGAMRGLGLSLAPGSMRSWMSGRIDISTWPGPLYSDAGQITWSPQLSGRGPVQPPSGE
jgi:hypothetical protein